MVKQFWSIVPVLLLALGLGLPAAARASDAAVKEKSITVAEKNAAVKRARLKTCDAEIKLHQARRDSAQAMASSMEKLADLAKKDADRAQKLKSHLAISTREVEETEKKYLQAIAAATAAKRAIVEVELQIELLQVKRTELQAEIDEANARVELLRLLHPTPPGGVEASPPAEPTQKSNARATVPPGATSAGSGESRVSLDHLAPPRCNSSQAA